MVSLFMLIKKLSLASAFRVFDWVLFSTFDTTEKQKSNINANTSFLMIYSLFLTEDIPSYILFMFYNIQNRQQMILNF